jgi:hypothetical protein
MITSGGNAKDASTWLPSGITEAEDGLSMGSTYDSGNQPV